MLDVLDEGDLEGPLSSSSTTWHGIPRIFSLLQASSLLFPAMISYPFSTGRTTMGSSNPFSSMEVMSSSREPSWLLRARLEGRILLSSTLSRKPVSGLVAVELNARSQRAARNMPFAYRLSAINYRQTTNSLYRLGILRRTYSRISRGGGFTSKLQRGELISVATGISLVGSIASLRFSQLWAVADGPGGTHLRVQGSFRAGSESNKKSD